MRNTIRSAHPTGLALAAATMSISGVSVLVNSYGVKDFPNAAVYTTAKNLVAALLVAALAASIPLLRARRSLGADQHGEAPRRRGGSSSLSLARLAGLAYVGVIGGGLAFALFFVGLSATTAVPAAFLHDTLVVFVALCCWPLLGERLSTANLTAIGLLFGGEVALSGGIGHLTADRGNLLVLAATLCWAVETVIARRLLASLSPATLALVRMGIGSLTLVAYLALTGAVGDLGRLDAHQLGWLLVTGCLLASYVATWMAALARARAIDVTSVLVGSVAVTALVQEGLGRLSLTAGATAGVGLVLAGCAVALVAWRRPAAA